ncbi:hypothetical protein LOK49_LG13G01933 [Camellia lanceoleosa]|uniref:Uncharacterized protein n=1 Tax=Camellia lanceoleosa TaxID=1840588 RepID=A0ACC0FLF6_9ERIC|nr:hypothetical protein LOK49_LG13G01933 [Camellia lanceoleosa]
MEIQNPGTVLESGKNLPCSNIIDQTTLTQITPKPLTNTQINTSQPLSSTSISPVTHNRVGFSKPRFKEPPDKHGGGRGELSNGTSQVDPAESVSVSHTGERSISPRHRRMVERRSKAEDSSLETSGCKPGATLHLNEPIEINDREPPSNEGIPAD